MPAITASASRCRPAPSSQRGDSGTIRRTTKTNAAGNAIAMKMPRQPITGNVRYASNPAAIKPIGQKPSRIATYLPRLLAGTISDTIDSPIGNSMPMPKPSSTRYSISEVTLSASPHIRLPTPQKIMLTWNTGLRPKRSASMPATAAPANMPRKLELASRPVCAALRPNSALIEPSTKVIMPRSIESKNHAVAMMPNKVR